MKNTTSADKAKSTTSHKCTYKHAELIRVCDKVSGLLLGYAAKPEKLFEYGKLGECNTYYQVTCDEVTGIWACTCTGNAEFHATCKHMRAAMELNELRLGVAKVEAEEVAEVAPVVVPAECQIGDMSVQDHLLNEELKRYESELRYEGIADLRMRVSHAELSVSSRSKEPLIAALVAHRRKTLLMATPVQEENISEVSAEMSAVCPVDVTLMSAFVDPVLSSEELPELPLAEEEVLSFEPLEEEEFSGAVADTWTAEEIERIRQAALPRKISTTEATLVAHDVAVRGTLNGNHGFRLMH
jgi:hypothetical protein